MTLRAFSQLSALGFSQEIITAEWPVAEWQQFNRAVLMGVRDWSDKCQLPPPFVDSYSHPLSRLERDRCPQTSRNFPVSRTGDQGTEA